LIRLAAASLTDRGQFRLENEDCVWSQIYSPPDREPLGLFIVCDGMGGHLGGRHASYWAVEAIKREFSSLFVSGDPRATLVLSEDDLQKVKAGELIAPGPPAEPNLEELAMAAVQKANYVVYDYARHKPHSAGNAGTTLTMAVLRGPQVVIANVGDSRTYLFRNGLLRLITRDHSVVASLVAEGQLHPEEIYLHPQRNVIYRYLGQKGQVLPDIFQHWLQPGDQLLLCSDGLWEMIRSEQELAELMAKAGDPKQACRDLVQAANRLGGEDNISAVVVKAT
jgi:protein phosphatase